MTKLLNETELVEPSKLIPYSNNPKKHPKKQIDKIASSIKSYGFIQPIVTDKNNEVIIGHGRLKAAKKLGLEKVPVIKHEDLTESEVKALRLADNRIAETDWEQEKLTVELEQLTESNDFENLIHGFDENEMEEYLQNLEQEETELAESQHEIPDNVEDWKILNLYAGIGGNRRFWPDKADITHVEYNEKIAEALRKFHPKDKVIVDDAHEYLLEHFQEFDFIWSSPPCPTHSKLRKAGVGKNNQGNVDPVYPDMDLYQQILLLKGYFNGKWIVENVKSWYDPLIKPQEVGRHYYWANFDVPKDTNNITEIGSDMVNNPNKETLVNQAKKYGLTEDQFELIPSMSDYPKDKIIRNMVHPKTGENILKAAVEQADN